MFFNVMDYAKPTEADPGSDRITFIVDPNEMYPAMIAFLKERLDQPAPTGYFRVLFAILTNIPDEIFAAALKPLDELDNEEARVLRASVLEVARKAFTEMLHLAIGQQPMHLRILKNETYKL